MWLLLVCAAGCDSEASPTGDGSAGDAGGDGGGDLSVGVDGGNDLANADLTCTAGTFPGFPGIASTTRTFDCSCGCTIDSFLDPNMVSGIWSGTQSSASFFVPTASGLEMIVDDSQTAPAIAGLSSILASDQWYLDGDFDLLADYEIVGGMVADGHAILQVNNLKSSTLGVYTVERDQTPAGADQYTGTLAGITPVSVATTATHGTLELKRSGFMVTAIADGSAVTQFTGGVLDRMAVVLTTALDGPCALDGGAPVDGSVPGCRLTVRWKNLRLASGVLVDRLN
jgi:hypothetical protein